jgi:hypothetical protein
MLRNTTLWLLEVATASLVNPGNGDAVALCEVVVWQQQ